MGTAVERRHPACLVHVMRMATLAKLRQVSGAWTRFLMLIVGKTSMCQKPVVGSPRLADKCRSCSHWRSLMSRDTPGLYKASQGELRRDDPDFQQG